MQKNSDYVVYTDGAYSPLRDQGGIGVVLLDENDKVLYQYSKAFKGVTNNKMELAAVIVALLLIKTPISSLTIKTDSQYVIGCATKGWKRKKNVKLWKKFDDIIAEKKKLISDIKFEWVKGHADNYYNDLCDELAVAATKELLDDEVQK